jgi:hypothetical protein
MTEILENIEGLFVYLDDILISGKSQQECYETLLHVLKRFSYHGERVNQDKCVFLTERVNYLGHFEAILEEHESGRTKNNSI